MNKILIRLTTFIAAIIPAYFFSAWIQQISVASSLEKYPPCYPMTLYGGKCTDTEYGGLFMILLPIMLIIFYLLIGKVLRRFFNA